MFGVGVSLPRRPNRHNPTSFFKVGMGVWTYEGGPACHDRRRSLKLVLSFTQFEESVLLRRPSSSLLTLIFKINNLESLTWFPVKY